MQGCIHLLAIVVSAFRAVQQSQCRVVSTGVVTVDKNRRPTGGQSDLRPTGRRKDEALRLRDRYWAMRLRAALPGESFSSIERLLWDTITVRRRMEGQGYSQPFALSKIASGKRGLSYDVEGTPKVVRTACSVWAESEAVFHSPVWTVLLRDAWQSSLLQRVTLDGEIRRRLPSLHRRNASSRDVLLNGAGICRLGRMTHIDALGLLLLNGTRHGGGQHEAFLANLFVPAVFARLCQCDAVFASLADRMQELIDERYPDVSAQTEPGDRKAFNSRVSRAWDLMPF